MKLLNKYFLLAAVLLLSATSFALPNHQWEIMRAMQDEMERSKTLLKRDNMPKPFFITYSVDQVTGFRFSANQGVLYETTDSADIRVKVSMRVGSPKEDNSFFDSYIFNSKLYPPAVGYDGLRAALWQETNKAYNDALSVFAKKQAYKKNKHIAEEYPDFSPAPTAKDAEMLTPAQIDKDFWRDITKAMSAQGNFKEIESFTVNTSIIFNPSYFLTSEGSKYIKDHIIVNITVSASAKTENGFEFQESRQFVYAGLEDVPAKEELLAKAKEFALQISDLTKSQKAEPFIGPVLLEQQAAAAMLNTLFTRGINKTKPLLSERNDPAQGEFTQKKGLKVMPVDFNVIDDPRAKTFKNTRLLGYRVIDDEGTPTQKLDLVVNGILKNLPTTRSLIKDQKVSTGNAYFDWSNTLFAQAQVTNLFFINHNPVPKAEFKAKFMQYCKDEGLTYCYIIKGSPFNPSLTAYKMDAETGAETPVHGGALTDLSARTLRDIIFAADDMEAYNIPNASTSVVAPSLILKEAEIKPAQKMPARKPLVPAP